MFTVIRQILLFIKDYLLSNLLKVLGIASGFGGFVYGIILKYALNYIFGLFGKEVTIIEQQQEIKKELKEYKDVINKPGATADEIKNAGKKILED